MNTIRVGIREFRERLAGFLESPVPVAITRHGETVGFYIPARPKRKDVDLETLRRAAAQLDSLIEAAGASEDELMQEYAKLRGRSPKAR